MTDAQKFEKFKENLIKENEKKYGAEIREKYGDKVADKSNAKLMGLTQEQYEQSENLRIECESALKLAVETGDFSGELARKACDLHRRWLCFFNPDYSKEYHRNLGEMYVSDERFKAYYEKIAEGCTEFLRDALKVYCV